MRSPSRQHPKLGSPRSLVSHVLALTVPLAFGACGSDDSPLAPSDPPAATAGEAAASADTIAAVPELALATTGQRILFTTNRTGVGYDLFKVDPLGNNLAHVTSFTDYESEPAWSFDNKRIAMVRPRRDANNVEHSDVFIMNADGTNKHWALSQPSSFDLRYPSWSPDGSHLAVAVTVGGKPYLATIEVATGNAKFVLSGGKVVQGNYASYEPGSKRILYVDGTGKEIDMLDPLTGTKYVMVSSETPMACPQFSPDRSKIAFQKVIGSNIDVYVKSVSPIGPVKRLTTDPAYDGVPTWSPDGSRIAFQSSRSGSAQIWIMNAATGGSLVRITHTNADEKSPAWSH